MNEACWFNGGSIKIKLRENGSRMNSKGAQPEVPENDSVTDST